MNGVFGLLIVLGLGVLVALPIVPVIRKRTNRRRVAVQRRRVGALASAAGSSDDELRTRLGAGDVNLRNPDGDTALHLAYYAGQRDAVARLKAFGADETLRNREGLTPAEMSQVAATERLIEQALACMTLCMWINEERGRPLYDALTQTPEHIYNPALVRVFLRDKHHRRFVCLAVKVGRPGSTARLVEILRGHGTKEMATVFLNSDSTELAGEARTWARMNGYTIHHTPGHEGARWGHF